MGCGGAAHMSHELKDWIDGLCREVHEVATCWAMRWPYLKMANQSFDLCGDFTTFV